MTLYYSYSEIIRILIHHVHREMLQSTNHVLPTVLCYIKLQLTINATDAAIPLALSRDHGYTVCIPYRCS